MNRQGTRMMKKSFFSLILSTVMVAGVIAAAAQQPDQQSGSEDSARQARHRPDPQRTVQMLAKRLNLTDDQKQKLLPVLTGQQEQMRSIVSDSSLSQADRREKIKALRQESDTRINSILNDEQKQKYAQLKQERMQRMHDRMDRQDGADHSNSQ